MIDEQRFADWLQEVCGVSEPRRVVRRDADRILVSKFEPGFAANLHDAMALLPELFDDAVMGLTYRVLAEGHQEATRTDTWQRAASLLVDQLGGDRSLGREKQAEVMAGVDSVAALLASILWSSPTVADEFVPHASEFEAYADAVARMDADRGVFSRHYGVYDGAEVVNHCPGAPFARQLLAQSWRICTGLPAPGSSQIGG